MNTKEILNKTKNYCTYEYENLLKHGGDPNAVATRCFGVIMFSLNTLLKMDLKQRTMDFILDTFRFSKGEKTKEDDEIWWAILDWDSIYKLSCIEKYPEYVKEFEEYFGEN